MLSPSQACLICSAPTRAMFRHGDSEVFWCDVCELGRAKGAFTPEMVASFYPEDYYTHRTGSERSTVPSILERVRIKLAWWMDRGEDFKPDSSWSGKSVLDIGCGNGGNLRMFKAMGCRTIGIEPDPKARAEADPAGEIFPGVAEDMPALPLQTFDIIVMSHVLEHCIDPSLAIANAAAKLATGGTLVIEVPNSSALGFAWFKGCWPWTDLPRHLSFFTRKSLSNLLSQNGLSVDRVSFTGFTRQFAPAWILDQVRISGARSPRYFSAMAWLLLVRSVFSGNEQRYDSIRVYARRA